MPANAPTHRPHAPTRRWRQAIRWGAVLAAAAFAGPLAGVAQGATPPVNTVLPSIAGAPTQGQTLTLTPGTWTGATSTSDQWMDCSSAASSSCTTPIAGATGNTYTLQSTDVSQWVAVVETATDTDTTTAMSTAPSNVLGPVTPPAPGNLTRPQISGTFTAGQVLTEFGDTWSNSPTSFTYQWLRCTNGACNKAITNGGNAQTYALKTADVGHTLEVQVTATNGGGSATALSDQTQAIAAAVPVPVNTGAPTISGTLQIGQTLTEGAASWTNSPTSIAFQWRRCDSSRANCQNIAGATAKTYTLTSDDLGATMQVAESATNAGGTTTAYSGITGQPVVNSVGVVPPPIVASGSAPAIAGNAQVGLTLTGSGAQFTNNPGTFSYQWLRCNPVGCSPIPGATAVTYTPTSADIGDSVALAETAANGGGTSDPVQSSRTDTITAPSTTAVQTNSSAPFAGQTVTLIATVTSAAGSVKPAGKVDFHANGGAIPGCTGLTLGSAAPTAVCQTSFPASVANVTAAYSATPGTFITGSSSSPTTLVVGRAATTLTVSPSGHVSLGSKTTYAAVVHPPASSLTPTGKVTFTDAGKVIKGCRNRALKAKRASCSVKYLGIKAHRISARYTGDANFAPAASITSHVLVQPQTPKGFVTVYMNWTFGFGPHSTTITALSASGISAGIGISLTCNGSGCPFKHHQLVVKAPAKCAAKAAKAKKKCAAPSSVDLTSIFGSAHLRVGTTFTVAITHSKWVGKYYRFKIRSGHRPSIAESCLAVNGTRPGVGCRAS